MLCSTYFDVYLHTKENYQQLHFVYVLIFKLLIIEPKKEEKKEESEESDDDMGFGK